MEIARARTESMTQVSVNKQYWQTNAELIDWARARLNKSDDGERMGYSQWNNEAITMHNAAVSTCLDYCSSSLSPGHWE